MAWAAHWTTLGSGWLAQTGPGTTRLAAPGLGEPGLASRVWRAGSGRVRSGRDLDRVKLVNDSYGHETGDEVIQAAVGMDGSGVMRTDDGRKFRLRKLDRF